jgi:hypothetical protein
MVSWRRTIRKIDGKRRKVSVSSDGRVRVCGYVNRNDAKGKNYRRHVKGSQLGLYSVRRW